MDYCQETGRTVDESWASGKGLGVDGQCGWIDGHMIVWTGIAPIKGGLEP